PKVLPGSQFLLETPEDKTLGIIDAVSRQNISEFNMSGQVTQVELAPDPATLPTGSALIPSRMGHSATTLSDGRVLLVGGIGVQGVLDSVEIYDPATQLVSQIDPLPEPRALHTATLIDGKVYLASGVMKDWSLATDLLVLDPTSMRFSAIPNVTLAIPRVG
ncbi:kelch repeat-containing protein, partial [Streptomyces sp. AGS-58]|uniref:kelch repeat-containing protein n=1 Tax=Streptomyces sp. AGS-58 TaxID=3331667 RepID=UPI0035A3A9ED